MLNKTLTAQREKIKELDSEIAQYRIYTIGSIALALSALILIGVTLKMRKPIHT